MLNMKRTKIMLIMILTIMEVCSIFLTWKSLSHKVTIRDDVKFKEENKKEKKAVAIMLNEGDGSYKESTSTTFPKVGYIYNSEKSGCIDTTGKEVVNAINYESGKVSLRLNQKLYCYLYFDKKEKPIIDKFYINDETSNKVTKEPEVTIHLKWSDQYIKEYCISETQDIDSCSWQTSNGVTEITSNYTFTEQTTKTFYAYIKDTAEVVSEIKSDSITYTNIKNGSDIATNPPTETTDGGGTLTGVAQDELEMRYYGTNPPNYICFGTSDKDTCVNDTDKYMYRIIGVTKDKGQGKMFKIIKKEALNATYKWYSSYTSEIKWPESEVYGQINGSAFLTNTTYMPSGWSDKIKTIKWKYGNLDNSDWQAAANKTASQMVQIEQAFTTTVSAKIGLMYLADYYYGLNKTGLNCGYASSSTYPQCANSWMHITQNDSSKPSSAYDMTMTSYGLVRHSKGNYAAMVVEVSGYALHNWYINNSWVRPVFYLIPSIEISGTGTQTDPYIIVS